MKSRMLTMMTIMTRKTNTVPKIKIDVLDDSNVSIFLTAKMDLM